jgi:hypothetical protein
MAGSPAIDTGSAGCGGLGVDQRGVLRPQPTGGTCDIGAFEVEQSPPPSGGGPATQPPSSVAPAKKCKKAKKPAAAAKKCKKKRK